MEGIDGFDGEQIILKPLHGAVGLAILEVLEEVRDLVLAHGAVIDGVAFKQGDFYFVEPREQEDFPFLFSTFFDGELEVRVVGADELGKFVKGRELFVFGEDTGVVGHGLLFLKVRIAKGLHRCYSRLGR